jgi:hypothetical protein
MGLLSQPPTRARCGKAEGDESLVRLPKDKKEVGPLYFNQDHGVEGDLGEGKEEY